MLDYNFSCNLNQLVIPNLKIIEIKNTLDLLEEMRKSLFKDYQVLIHSMAVSDYTPVYMTSIDEVQASQDLSKFLTKQNTESKISSKEDAQILFLRKILRLFLWSKNGILKFI